MLWPTPHSDCLTPRMPVIRVARHAAHPEHQGLFERGGNRHFDTELVGRPGLAFGDTFDLGRVQRIQLALVPGLLRQDAVHAVQQVLRPWPGHALAAERSGERLCGTRGPPGFGAP